MQAMQSYGEREREVIGCGSDISVAVLAGLFLLDEPLGVVRYVGGERTTEGKARAIDCREPRFA